MKTAQGLSRRAIVAVIGLGLCACLARGMIEAAIAGGEDVETAKPKARVETETVPSAGDAADDPAIWVHPGDAALSLVLGTDKKGGLNVFDLDGRRLQVVSDGSRPNNVDVIYGFPLGKESVDLAVAGTRTRSRFGVGFWRIEAAKRSLSELGPMPAFTVFGGGEPYGSCVYRSAKDRSFYVFITSKDGDVEQYRIESAHALGAASPIRATRVRTLSVGSTVEGCVADHELGWLYVGEENVGIWKYGAEPDSGSNRTAVARVGENGLVADVEGLTIYYAAGSKGYLIASSQGASTFKVYRRDGNNPFEMTIDPAAGAISDVGETDGIDVTNVATSSKFPRGLFVCQDGKGGRDGHQNFKFFAWDEIAQDRLIVDTSRAVRLR
jgi:3-phytase